MVHTAVDLREALLDEIEVYLELMLDLAERAESDDCSGGERRSLQSRLAVLQRQVDLVADQLQRVNEALLCAVPA